MDVDTQVIPGAIAAVFGGLTGLISTVVANTKEREDLKSRLAALESQQSVLKQREDDRDKIISVLEQRIQHSVDTLDTRLTAKLDHTHSALHQELTNLRAEIQAVSSARIDDIRENGKAWNVTQRILGRIEQYLGATQPPTRASSPKIDPNGE